VRESRPRQPPCCDRVKKLTGEPVGSMWGDPDDGLDDILPRRTHSAVSGNETVHPAACSGTVTEVRNRAEQLSKV
jgi:hypothetical protein